MCVALLDLGKQDAPGVQVGGDVRANTCHTGWWFRGARRLVERSRRSAKRCSRGAIAACDGEGEHVGINAELGRELRAECRREQGAKRSGLLLIEPGPAASQKI